MRPARDRRRKTPEYEYECHYAECEYDKTAHGGLQTPESERRAWGRLPPTLPYV